MSTADTVSKLGLDSRYEVLVPESSARPWTPPSGFLCVYESFFKEGRLVFPLPRPLVDFCVRKDIALSQLTPLAVLHLVALLVFGAEAKQLVDAEFLEKSVTLVSLQTTPGTFYLQTKRGFLTKKPSKAKGTTNAGEWSDFYIFVRATPEVVGVGAPSLRQDWNRKIGVEYKDQRPDGYTKSHELLVGHLLDVSKGRTHESLPLSRVKEAMEAINSIDWDDFRERPRVEKEVRTRSGKRKRTRRPDSIVEVVEEPDLLDGLGWDLPQPAGRPTQGGKGPRALDILREASGVPRDGGSAAGDAPEAEEMADDVPLEDRRAEKRARKTKTRSPAKLKLGLNRVECLDETRKASEARKRKEAAKQRAEVARPSTSDSGALIPETAGLTPAPASFLSSDVVLPDSGVQASDSWVLETPRAGRGGSEVPGPSSEATPAQTEGVDSLKRHKVYFKYKGAEPLAKRPGECLRLVRAIPEMAEGISEDELRDPTVAAEELAAGHVWLLSLQSRLERAHQAEVDGLKARVSEGVRALEACEEAKGKIAEDLARERERTRVKDGELARLAQRVEELGVEAENCRRDFVRSNCEAARLTAEVDIRTRERDESREQVGRMDGLCRRQVARMLKQQRGQFKKECKKQSRRAVKVVRGYLESRRPWNRVDKLVSQAEQAERILRRLQTEGVSIPEEKVADIVALKEKYLVERAQIGEKALSAQDFEFSLPSDLGVPNLDQLDFTGGFAFGDEDGLYLGDSGDDEDESEDEASAEGDEGEEVDEEEDDEEEEEEEEEVPLLAKGAASAVRAVSENPQPVSEAGGTIRDVQEGLEENRPAAAVVRSEAQSGVGSVPVVSTAAEDATVVVRPGGDQSDGVVPEGQPGGNVSEEVPCEGEENSLAADGAPADVRPETGTRVEGEKTPPAAEGATSGVPEEGGARQGTARGGWYSARG